MGKSFLVFGGASALEARSCKVVCKASGWVWASGLGVWGFIGLHRAKEACCEKKGLIKQREETQPTRTRTRGPDFKNGLNIQPANGFSVFPDI